MDDQSSGRRTVLCVDDNDTNLRIIHAILNREFDLVEAASGEEALEILAHTMPDIVLLDILMPGIDGYETCRRIRANPRLAQTKVILVSAKDLTEERLLGYESGADDYITKPFDQAELLAKVRVFSRLKTVEGIERIKSDLLTVLDHEIRGPLCSILPPSEMLATSDEVDEEHRVMLAEMILASGRRLLKLTERGLLYCRLQENAADVRPETLDIKDAMRRLAERSGPEVRWGEPEESVAIEFDPALFATMAESVIDGAKTLLAPIESIEVELVTLEGGGHELSWWIAGPQATEEQAQSAFEFLGNRVVGGETVGSDVSMALAQTIAQRFGARIRIESRPGGTCFRLPVRCVAAAAGGARP